jgi:hypothetical protein
MKKYQFSVRARSIEKVRELIAGEAFQQGIENIQCIAIYRTKQTRLADKAPVRVWHTDFIDSIKTS